MAEEVKALRIKRTKDAIYIESLKKPDAAGNTHWRQIGMFKPDDQLHTKAGWKKASDCTDEEITQALK